MTTMDSPPRRRDPVLRWTPGDKPGEIRNVQLLWATTAVMISWGDGTPREQLNISDRKEHIYEHPGAYRLRMRQSGGQQQFVAQAQIVIRDHNPAVTITRDADNPTLVTATAGSTLDNTGIVPRYRVQWDNIHDPTTFTDFWGTPNAKTHKTMPAGVYTARITDVGTQRWVETTYTIPESTLDCEITVTGRTATLTVTKATAGKDLVVSWGDITPTEPVNDGTATHDYPPDKDDTYLVQLVYADASESVVKVVTIPGGAR